MKKHCLFSEVPLILPGEIEIGDQLGDEDTSHACLHSPSFSVKMTCVNFVGNFDYFSNFQALFP